MQFIGRREQLPVNWKGEAADENIELEREREESPKA